MATGDQSDFVRRLRQLLPDGWFPSAPGVDEEEQAPVLVGVLTGFASVFAWIWSLFDYVNDQTRLQTSTGSSLDMHAVDLFGEDGFPRNTDETDASYLARIQEALVAGKNTRAAIIAAVNASLGVTPTIIEPTNAEDCKGYGSAASPAMGGGYGYNNGLHYGHLSGGQFFLTAVVSSSSDKTAVYAAINRTKAEGVVAWVQCTGSSALLGEFETGFNSLG